MLTRETELLLRAEQRTKRFDFTLQLSTADLPLVTLSFSLLQLSLKTRHLVNTLLAVTASCKGVGFALFNLGRRFCRGTAFC